jgi:CheY-like chemotaxis protein
MGLILFVDDDVLTLQLMEKATQLLGHRSVLCSSGIDALQIIGNLHPDLVLVDIGLQDMNGFEFVRKMREIPGEASTPIIIVSAASELGKNEEAQRSGANGYLGKPLSLDRLSATIKSFVNSEK